MNKANERGALIKAKNVELLLQNGSTNIAKLYMKVVFAQVKICKSAAKWQIYVELGTFSSLGAVLRGSRG